jgi:hypothetical protein
MKVGRSYEVAIRWHVMLDEGEADELRKIEFLPPNKTGPVELWLATQEVAVMLDLPISEQFKGTIRVWVQQLAAAESRLQIAVKAGERS